MCRLVTHIRLLLLPIAAFAGDSLDRQLTAITAQRQAVEHVQRESIEKRMQPSLALQHAAAIRQNADFFTNANLSDSAAQFTESEPYCEPLSPLRAAALIDREARRTGLRPDLLHAVIRQESAFRPCAISAKGAMGLMQLMPATARELGMGDPFDPSQNVSGGATFLKQLVDRYSGDLNRALGAYNAGSARVDAANGVPQIGETLDYVRNIINMLPISEPP